MKNAFKNIWQYIRSMNSEPGPDGGISIKRNTAFIAIILLVFVEAFSLIVMAIWRVSWKIEATDFTAICRFYAGLDVVFILLVLQITSVEKLVAAWQAIKGNKPEPAKDEPIKIINSVESKTEIS